jgi:hypothetical protein
MGNKTQLILIPQGWVDNKQERKTECIFTNGNECSSTGSDRKEQKTTLGNHI